ncbi:MAG: DNA translocase FtsK [Clostridia bacterium]
MATKKSTQQKSTKTSSHPSAPKKTSTTRKTASKSKKAPVKKSRLSRESWGIIYIIASVITLFSILNFDGFLLSFTHNIITFCIGFGIYVLPISLIIMAIYCFIPFVGNVPLRTLCILSAPLTTACFTQILFYNDDYSLNLDSIALIIENGLVCKSAGLVGGLMSLILQASLSSVGAVIVLSLFIILSVFIGFRISPRQIINFFIDTFNEIHHEQSEEEIEYNLSKREMKKAHKERKQEYNQKLKEEKERAYEEYKQEIKEQDLAKRDKLFNFTLRDNRIKKQKITLESATEDTSPQISEMPKKEEKIKLDAWMLEEHNKRKAIDKLKKEAKSMGFKVDDKGEIIGRIDDDLSKEVLDDTSAETLEINDTTENVENTENIDTTDIVDTTLDTTENSVDTLVESDNLEDTLEDQTHEIRVNIDTFNAESINISKDNEQENVDISEELDFSFNNDEIVEEISQGVNEILDNSFADEFDVLALKKAIEENIDEITQEYEFAKKEIIPDLLKSTMKYDPVSNFDSENLAYKYTFPPVHLLKPKLTNTVFDYSKELEESSERLIATLASFNISAQIINIVRGPSITRFEITMETGIKISKLTGLSEDIALSLGAVSVFISPIPDKIAIGIEVPNKTTEMVLIREVIESLEFKNTTSKLSYALGHNITGQPAIGDIAKMPHMLVAGTTGSGKSVCVNSMLVSILYKADPTEVKFIMIDPKMVELGGYNGIPHLLIPVVTDPQKAAGALNWAVGEMMRRYGLLKDSGVKDLASYNMLMEQKIADGDETASKLPQIVIVIDELADLMLVAAKEVEESICRIAQMARAAGMHLVIATQRPSTDVITGIMKANIPSRVSFAVSSRTDSGIILDQNGAEKLIGKGDMLYKPLGAGKPERLQGCFITSTEVEAVVDFVKSVAEPDYSEDVINHIENHSSSNTSSGGSASSDGLEDDMTESAIDLIVSSGKASTSFLQTKLRLGYARASRIMDEIEERGIIGPADGAKQREIYLTKQQWQEMKIRQMD